MKDYDLLMKYCKTLYYIGTGNFWYEEGVIGDDNSIIYYVYSFSLYAMYVTLAILELLAGTIGDYPPKEKSDGFAAAVTHVMILVKIYVVISNKKIIKRMIRDLIKVCENFEVDYLMAEKYRIIKINIIIYFIVVYATLFAFIIQGIINVIKGSNFVAFITYYPSYYDHSVLATLFNVFMSIDCIIYTVIMILLADSFAVIHLIILKYKFKTLRNYLHELHTDVDEMVKEGYINLASEKLRQGLIKAIWAHNELLRLTLEFDDAFGFIIAMQIIQSSGSAIVLMLQTAESTDFTLIYILKAMLFIVGLFFMLGLFLCNAGEITHQASLLSNSFFYCGWYLCLQRTPSGPDVRRLVIIGCNQAQRPLIMKAFKMFDLSYATFLAVVRGSYSVFTLIYTRKQ